MSEQTDVNRLVVVERSEVNRLGRAAVARRALGPSWRVDTAADSPTDVWATTTTDGPVDVVLVVVAADGAGFDRYDVVDRLPELRSARTADGSRPGGPALLVATVHDNPLLDIRLASAGAHSVVPVEAVSRSDDGQFASVVQLAVGRRRRSGASGTTSATTWAGTDPAAVLAYVVDHGIEAAFTPGSSQLEAGLSRRGIMRVRRDLAELGGIRPSLHRYTGGTDRRIELPTWREVVTYVNCARGEVDWGDDAWGNGAGPRIGQSRFGVHELVSVARELIA